MNIIMSEYISEIVYSKIRETLDNPNAIIHKTDRLIEDLNIDDDELSFFFINELEEVCGVMGNNSDWKAVSTVQDTIDLLIRLYEEEKQKEARGETRAQRIEVEEGFPTFIKLYMLFIVSLLLLLFFM